MKNRKRMAIIGAGPIGLEAAARAVSCGFDVTVFERGDIAENVRSWGHVTLFSPFGMNRSDLGLRLIREASPAAVVPDDDAVLTGRNYVEAYLSPLADVVSTRCRLTTQTHVTAVGREGLLKHELIGNAARTDAPFRLLVRQNDIDRIEHAEFIVDASGTYGVHNQMGCGGISAPGETDAARSISYLLDDVIGEARHHYAGKRVLLVGSGYSAATTAVALADLASQVPHTRVTWMVRGADAAPIKIIRDDPLVERRRLTERANAVVSSPPDGFEYCSAMSIDRLSPSVDGSVSVTACQANGSQRVFEVDRIIANVGFMPDRSLYRELQMHECYATFGPIKLAAALLGAPTEDCLEQRSPGADELSNPEPGFVILGSKSYGRNSSFLIRVGLEQIHQLFGVLSTASAVR